MTLSEAFIFKAGNGISSTDADTVLEFSGLDPSSDWEPGNTTLKCSFYEALLAYLDQDNVGIKSQSEGGYSITYERGDKNNYMYNLALESGCQKLIDKYNPQPKVQNMSNLW